MPGTARLCQRIPADGWGKRGDSRRIFQGIFTLRTIRANSSKNFADEERDDSFRIRRCAKGPDMSDSDCKPTPHFLLTTEGELHGQDTEENREIVRRIHACVNACEGISTEELEKGIIADMRRVLAQVVPVLERQQRKSA
jgi:hypothetical protein